VPVYGLPTATPGSKPTTDFVDGSLGRSTRVTISGNYLKVKQVATVDAEQDAVIKAGAIRQINSGVIEISALNGIRLEAMASGSSLTKRGTYLRRWS
jgi:hypothetical protein